MNQVTTISALIALLGATLVIGASIERREHNQRDAGLLLVLGALSMVGAIGVWAFPW